VCSSDLARNKSKDYYADNAGDMGSRMVYELISEIPDSAAREQAINLAKGSLSSVIKTGDKSWVFFRAEETASPADSGDPLVIQKVRGYIMAYERGRVEDWSISAAGNFIAAAKTSGFGKAAADFAVTKQTFGPLPLNYGNAVFFTSVQSSGISELNNAGTNEKFWQACFNTPLNTPSDPVVAGSNVLVLYPLEEKAADEEEAGFIEMYYTYFLAQSFEQDIRTYFLNSGKMNDRFWDVFQYFIE
jgi:hypothetical protein